MNHMNTLNGASLKIEERNLVDRLGRSRIGNYMHTSNGLKYWPFDPRPDEVYIEVIAQHLACQGRWQGAIKHKTDPTKIFLSVAEHSVMVATYLCDEMDRPDLALEGLLHDGSEGYIGDLIRPLKYSPDFRAPFFAVEEINESAIARRFDLVYPFPKEIKIADEAVCTAENEQGIYHHPDEEWESGKLHDSRLVAPYEVKFLNPYEAKELFMIAFKDIMADRCKYREMPTASREAS